MWRHARRRGSIRRRARFSTDDESDVAHASQMFKQLGLEHPCCARTTQQHPLCVRSVPRSHLSPWRRLPTYNFSRVDERTYPKGDGGKHSAMARHCRQVLPLAAGESGLRKSSDTTRSSANLMVRRLRTILISTLTDQPSLTACPWCQPGPGHHTVLGMHRSGTSTND